MRGRIRIGALGIVDEQHMIAAADLFHAVGEAGKAAQTLLQDIARDTKRLKDAEELMHNATYRLGQVLHMVSGDDRKTASRISSRARRTA